MISSKKKILKITDLFGYICILGNLFSMAIFVILSFTLIQSEYNFTIAKQEYDFHVKKVISHLYWDGESEDGEVTGGAVTDAVGIYKDSNGTLRLVRTSINTCAGRGDVVKADITENSGVPIYVVCLGFVGLILRFILLFIDGILLGKIEDLLNEDTSEVKVDSNEST